MKHLMLHFSRGGTHGSSDRLGVVAWENVVEYLTSPGKVLVRVVIKLRYPPLPTSTSP